MNTLAEQIRAHYPIPAVAAEALADYVASGSYSGGQILVGIGELSYSENLYSVIWQVSATRWDIAAGYIDRHGNFKLYHAARSNDVQTHRWHMTFMHKCEYFATFEPELSPEGAPAVALPLPDDMPVIDEDEPGYIYVLQFDRPLGTERHQAAFYGGWSRFLDQRLNHHAAGRGAAITRYAVRHGIGFKLVYSAPGTPADEKAMKARKNYRQFLQSVGVAV